MSIELQLLRECRTTIPVKHREDLESGDVLFINICGVKNPTFYATLSPNGRIMIPAWIQEKMNLDEGDTLEVEIS